MIAKDIYGYKIFRINIATGDVVAMLQQWTGRSYNILGENHYTELQTRNPEPLILKGTSVHALLRRHRKHGWKTVRTGKNLPGAQPELSRQGFYVWRTFAEAYSYQDRADIKAPVDFHYIIAKVRIWGDVVHCENLMIAENLEFVEIYSNQNGAKRRAISHKIGWPGKVYPYPIKKEDVVPWQIQARLKELSGWVNLNAKPHPCKCLSCRPPRSRLRYLRRQGRNKQEETTAQVFWS